MHPRRSAFLYLAVAGLALGALARDSAAQESPSAGLRGTSAPPAAAMAAAAPRVSRGRTRAPIAAPRLRPGVTDVVRSEARAPIVSPEAPPDVPRRPRRPALDNPYEPLGIRAGGFLIRPSLEESVGYDSNPNRTGGAGRKGSPVSRTEGQVLIESDWQRHSLTGALRGSYSAYPRASEASRPEGEGRLDLRLDATRDTRIDLGTRFRLDTQRPGSPELTSAVTNRPLVEGFGASAGIAHRFNRLEIGLRASADRTIYEDAELSGGGTLDLSDRNVNEYALRLRAGYELHPGLVPFVEGQVDRRIHDRDVDSSGYRRDSDGVTLRAGSTFEITRTLTGEVSAGIQNRDYADERLPELRGPVAEAALIWSATPLTTVRVSGRASLDETSIAGASGSSNRRVAVEMTHDLRRWLSLTLAAGIGETDYDGVTLRDTLAVASIGLDYKLTRSLALRTSFTHERLKSTNVGSDYTANLFLVGLRFQR